MYNSAMMCVRLTPRWTHCFAVRWLSGQASKLITWNDVSTALRPFYFIVHPDMFWNHPEEKQTNENSLKQLNAYIESLLLKETTRPLNLNFYLRQTKSTAPSTQTFRNVQINLSSQNVHATVHRILTSCSLPTNNLDSLNSSPQYAASRDERPTQSSPRYEYEPPVEDDLFARHEWTVDGRPSWQLERFLRDNADLARERLAQSGPARVEAARLSKQTIADLGLEDLRWECDWGTGHHRGSLESFRRLCQQHPGRGGPLRGRTLVLGRTTGVSLDGHVVLSTEDVRHSWLSLLRSLPRYDVYVGLVPAAERALSDALRGIRVEHRRFKPSVAAKAYVQQLSKLTVAIHRHIWSKGLPGDWPARLSDHQLGVECEAGPLMLSPTGQFLAPASCPPALLLDFVGSQLGTAEQRRRLYCSQRRLETQLHQLCMEALQLDSLSKEDDVTPDRMVTCCERLLKAAPRLRPLLAGCSLHVSHYCSVLQDGLVCLPWDWRE
ncbi:LOW QUALITY PROTEIN: T-cell activation inhibitor, mitochondrial-like [Haemaphysalis longicornis]